MTHRVVSKYHVMNAIELEDYVVAYVWWDSSTRWIDQYLQSRVLCRLTRHIGSRFRWHLSPCHLFASANSQGGYVIASDDACPSGEARIQTVLCSCESVSLVVLTLLLYMSGECLSRVLWRLVLRLATQLFEWFDSGLAGSTDSDADCWLGLARLRVGSVVFHGCKAFALLF